ncbi:deoxyribodipyrimidine photo-lyase [Pontibacter sp. SGAir0037]|uniref:cryptochrome/photolyase family protein n=1 Tax=Pontibacter sp. SGAir0037 TaxID=2571030 RepID=UPI0010CD2D91|nr:deoxyribodipyrimidine photo-lyase [Pontibacter sp. SGAir0037]QCR24836.1 deoxyribodipyrimidine photolyase [Pontibacter sp. SGAir0037]
MKKITLFWFRRDLRLHDNTGFHRALTSGTPVLPLFIFDKDILDKLSDKTDARVNFIHQTVAALQEQLHAMGSTLLVQYGLPEEILSSLCRQYNITAVYTNRDYEPYARTRDTAVEDLLSAKGVGFYTFKDQVIFEQEEILSKTGSPYKIYTPYKKAWLQRFAADLVAPIPSKDNLHQLLPHTATALPSLSEMGFAPSAMQVPAPRLSADVLRAYEDTRNIPALDATSRISPYLRFGLISVRDAVVKAIAHNQVWLQELIWREFFMQLLYHFPITATESFYPKFRAIEWRNNEEEFERWCNGTTGFPLVDAGMRELNATGFMHNRVRMVVASFLIKDLLIDWRWGEAYFAEKLLDYELASNAGNWQWAAGTGADAQPYFRIFNPDSQVTKFDKDYTYIKRWVPEYGTAAYPKPMLQHKEASSRALEAYKKSIAAMAP